MLRLRDDMVALRTSADHMEEKLKAEILFLKEQIQAEQCLKENLEDTLQLEIEGYKEEIGETKMVNANCPVTVDQVNLSNISTNKLFKTYVGMKPAYIFLVFWIFFTFSSVSPFISPLLITFIQTSWKV